jgi:hypothetical protein
MLFYTVHRVVVQRCVHMQAGTSTPVKGSSGSSGSSSSSSSAKQPALGGSAKLDRLLEELQQLHAQDPTVKAVIFSQW